MAGKREMGVDYAGRLKETIWVVVKGVSRMMKRLNWVRVMGVVVGCGVICSTEALGGETQPAATQAAVEVDLSTPHSAMVSLVRALAAGDREGAYKCIAVDSNRAPTELDELMAWNIAQSQLMAAGTKAFGKGAEVFRSSAGTFDQIAKMLRDARGEPATAVMNEKGDEAAFTVTIPQAVIDKATPEQAENLKAWAGHKMWCKKVGTEWKFDMDRSMRVEVILPGAPEVSEEAKVARNVEVLKGLAEVKAGVAADVQSFSSAEEAAAAIKNGDRLVVRAAHGRGLTIHVLPAKEGVREADRGNSGHYVVVLFVSGGIVKSRAVKRLEFGRIVDEVYVLQSNKSSGQELFWRCLCFAQCF